MSIKRYGFHYLIMAILLVSVSSCKKEEVKAVQEVSASFATAVADTGKDTVDDPAIYVHPTDPSKSFVLGTDKNKKGGGLRIFDLEGNQLSFMPDGRMNNVDIRYGFSFGGKKIDIAVATHRTEKSLAIYEIKPDERGLSDRIDADIQFDFEPYGGCLYQNKEQGKLYFFVTSKKGDFEQWALFDKGDGKISAKKARTLPMSSQAEGCVVDDMNKVIFVGEEDKAILKYEAEPEASDEHSIVDRVGVNLTADIEGLALYKSGENEGYLIASSQGDSTYAVYDRKEPHVYIGSFRIVAKEGMEGTEETDGIAVTNFPLGANFPKGLFIAHDNRESKGGGSNFKYVSWEKIKAAL
jgi:3-phytase